MEARMQNARLPKAPVFIKNVSLCLAFALALVGCGGRQDENPPVFSGTNYAAVVTNSPTDGMPQAGMLALFYYPDGPNGAKSLVWPYLIAQDEAVFDKLVIFNGGLTDDVSWKYYPALLAYEGSGKVIEITQAACRQIPGWQSNWTNYAFAVLSTSNQYVRLDASQCGELDSNRPRRLEVDLNKADILKAILAAAKNPDEHEFKGVKYLVAP